MPLIGIPLDWKENFGNSIYPHLKLRENYFQAVRQAGGLPVGLLHEKETIPDLLERVDGLLIPGGGHAILAKFYLPEDGAMPYQPEPRSYFDLDLIEAALKKKMPILGICAGMQALGVLHGCQMTRDVCHHLHSDLIHDDLTPTVEPIHDLILEPGTLLARIAGVSQVRINSRHKEALATTSEQIIVSAKAPDGCIEAIEVKNYPFALGVQWHPEYLNGGQDGFDFKIIQAFVHACQKETI